MEVSEAPKTGYEVQYYFMSDKEWLTVGRFKYYTDAVIDLGKHVEINPNMDHRIIRVSVEVAIEVPSIDTEKME